MKTEQYYQRLHKSNPSESVQIFAEFCLEQIRRVENEEILMTEACYEIAGTMFIEQVEQNDDLLALATDAGVLELPDHHLLKSRDELWVEFKDGVAQLIQKS